MAAPSQRKWRTVQLQVAELDFTGAFADARAEAGLLKRSQAVCEELDQGRAALLVLFVFVLVGDLFIQVPNLNPDSQRKLRACDDPLHLARVQSCAGFAVDDVLGLQLRLPTLRTGGVAHDDTRRPEVML